MEELELLYTAIGNIKQYSPLKKTGKSSTV